MGGTCSCRRGGRRRLSDQELARCLLMVEARLAQHDATLDLHEAAISFMQGAAEEAGVALQPYEVQHAQSQHLRRPL